MIVNLQTTLKRITAIIIVFAIAVMPLASIGASSTQVDESSPPYNAVATTTVVFEEELPVTNIGKLPTEYLRRIFVDDEGREIAEVVFPGRPPEIKVASSTIPEPNPAMGINVLPSVPAFDWCYGCSATAGAMMMGYYDNVGYPNMYTGPTNGGVCPMDNSVWGSGECPLSATHEGYDGLAVRGHVDDYWISSGNGDPDPFIGQWPEHTHADCTGDFMGTNQSLFHNHDGATRFYFDTNGDPLYNYTEDEPEHRDGCHGLRLFAQSRGYDVTTNFSQLIHGVGSDPDKGFTFNDFQAEINAGRPVFIQVEGHSMLGYGYDTDGFIIYIHDTWNYNNHEMTWGGKYAGRQHFGVTVVRLKSEGQPDIAVSPPSFNVSRPVDTTWSSTLNVGNVGSTALVYNISDRETAGASSSAGTESLPPEGIQAEEVGCPWLNENPKSGSVVPGNSAAITTTINTAGLVPGDYHAEIVISNNDPDEDPTIVPVTLHVTPNDNNPPNLPGNPIPANHATEVSINTNLNWTGGDPDAGDTVTYEVYFGTSASPPLKDIVGPYPATQSSITCNLGILNGNNTYYWKIVAADNHGASTEGPVWDFTTQSGSPIGSAFRGAVTVNDDPGEPGTQVRATVVENPAVTTTAIVETAGQYPWLMLLGSEADVGKEVAFEVKPVGTTIWLPATTDPADPTFIAFDHQTVNLFVSHTNNPPNLPGNPIPANHATEVSINTDLIWTGGGPDAGDTVTYEIYFGTSASPPFKEIIGPYPATQSSITYDPGILNDNITYYWKIIAVDNHGASTEGPVWDFTTTGSPGSTVIWNCPIPYIALISPYPANGRDFLTTAVDLSQVLYDVAWFSVYYLDETTGIVSYYDSFIQGGTLTQLQPWDYYYVVLPIPGTLQIPQ